MKKETWRDISEDINDSIFTPIFYILYKTGSIDKKTCKKLITREVTEEGRTLISYMDELDKMLK